MTTPAETPASTHTRVHLIAHTHWDREWYRTQTAYQHRLVRVLDDLLTGLQGNPEARFTLDGQLAPLEDYLEARPEREAQLRDLVRSGRVSLGPWYVLADEYLVGGEALLRNLERGRRVAARFGPVTTVGYIPDSFGHPESLPMLLRGFGVSSAVFQRGAPLRDQEFTWRAPDGSEVLAVYLVKGYCGGSGYPCDPEEQRKFLNTYAADLQERTRSGVLPLTVGCDHMSARTDLRGVDFDLGRAEVSDLADLVRDVRASVQGDLPVVTGELREGREHLLLPGVAGTRTYLKRLNNRTEAWLTRYAEPLAALTGLDAPTLDVAWRDLLLNHPHDSICGCSIDEVHRQMLARFERAREGAELVFTEAFGKDRAVWRTARDGETPHLALFNPLPREFSGWVDAEFQLAPGVRDLRPSLDGEALRVDLFEPLGYGAYLTENPDLFPDFVVGERYRLRLHVTLPPLSVRSVKLEASTVPRPVPAAPARSPLNLRADHAGVHFERAGLRFRGVGLLVSEGDAGDSYNHSPPNHDERVRASVTGAADASGEHARAARLDLNLRVPRALGPGHARRADERVDLPATLGARDGGTALHLCLRGENTARDHRLKLVIPLPFRATGARAAGPYALTSRPLGRPDDAGWLEPFSPAAPFTRMLIVDGEHGAGLAVATHDLTEYELHEDRLELTVLRAVGWLSRSDLRSRPHPAGPPFEVPEAQCAGPFEADVALLPFVGDVPWDELEAALYPPRGVLVHAPVTVGGDLSLPAPLQLGTLRAHDGDLQLRAFNPGDEHITVPLGGGLQGAVVTRADTSPSGGTEPSLPPRGLLTLRLPSGR